MSERTALQDEKDALRERLAVAFRSCTRSPHHLAFLVEPIVLGLMAEAWDEGANAAVEPVNTGTRMTLQARIPFPAEENPYRVTSPEEATR
jgi:hypothetical protein